MLGGFSYYYKAVRNCKITVYLKAFRDFKYSSTVRCSEKKKNMKPRSFFSYTLLRHHHNVSAQDYMDLGQHA